MRKPRGQERTGRVCPLPKSFYQGAIADAFVWGDQRQALSAGGGGDEAVGGVEGEVLGELRRQCRDFRGNGFDGHARAVHY
jgi:hypothetical protein